VRYGEQPACREVVARNRGHPVSDIEFEAEMTGFMEIVRALRERRFFRMLRSGVRSYRDRDGSGVRHGKEDQTTCDFSPNR
jgi:hypothetical protein